MVSAGSGSPVPPSVSVVSRSAGLPGDAAERGLEPHLPAVGVAPAHPVVDRGEAGVGDGDGVLGSGEPGLDQPAEVAGGSRCASSSRAGQRPRRPGRRVAARRRRRPCRSRPSSGGRRPRGRRRRWARRPRPASGLSPRRARGGVGQDRRDVGEVAAAELAVDEPVVEAEREGGDPARLDALAAVGRRDDPRASGHRAEREDRRLARVEDGRAGVDAEDADVGDRDRAAGHVGGLGAALAGGGGEGADRLGELAHRHARRRP